MTATALLLAATLAAAAPGPPAAYPAWDGAESVEAYARRVGLPAAERVALGGGVTLEMVLVPAGRFFMGAGPGEEAVAGADTAKERPRHEVAFARPFYVGKYEVTQAQWLAAVGDAVSLPGGRPPAAEKPAAFADHPIAGVSMAESLEFCAKASAAAKREVRLPTEAEWEYACRAGTSTPFYFGADWRKQVRPGAFQLLLDDYAWRPDDGKPGKVGRLKPNAWGLYDLYGNVAERTLDPHHPDYEGAPADGSAWEKGGGGAMTWVRGGSADNGGPLHFRSAARTACLSVNFRAPWLGMRVVAPVGPPK